MHPDCFPVRCHHHCGADHLPGDQVTGIPRRRGTAPPAAPHPRVARHTPAPAPATSHTINTHRQTHGDPHGRTHGRTWDGQPAVAWIY